MRCRTLPALALMVLASVASASGREDALVQILQKYGCSIDPLNMPDGLVPDLQAGGFTPAETDEIALDMVEGGRAEKDGLVFIMKTGKCAS